MRRLLMTLAVGSATWLLIPAGVGQSPPPAPRLGDPLAGLSPPLRDRFTAGRVAFAVVETPADGLGPVFNGRSCVECHNQGAPGGGSTVVETRFGRTVGGLFDPLVAFGGSLIQTDGIGLAGRTIFVGETVPAAANVVAGRRATPLFGLGLVDAVPDATLLALADDQHRRTPATAGRAAVVIDVASGLERVGRFGWKCQNATLLTFSGDAYVNELGVTTPLFPDENCPQGNCAELADDPVPGVDDGLDDVQAFTDFMTLLAPPPPLPLTGNARAGAVLFGQLGCAACHTPALRSGPSPVKSLSGVAFAPFSDFLLHDMGPLGDGIAQADAGPREIRTAPLWGLRFLTRLLHDGRALTVEAAILAHDGQGRAARDRFASLPAARKGHLRAFLGTL